MIDYVLKRLDAFLERSPKNAVMGLSLLAAVGVGVLDYFSTPDLLVLYLAPLFIAAWYGSWAIGAAVAIYSAGSAFITSAYLGSHFELDKGELVTLLVRFAGFLLIAHVISRLRESRRQAGFIVHDVRSPIASAISGLMTLQQSGENLGESEREMLDLALVSSQRAVMLVNSLLDIAKLESGKMQIAPESVSLETFVNDCWSQVELWARQTGVTLAKELDVDHATLDPSLTSRVLVNLLSNAIKYSPRSGVVTVRSSIHHHALKLAIVDEGPGIPRDLAKTVFQPFAQAENSQAGTGLGLTFCRLAVHAQHGHIWVDGHAEKGTTIVFTIPQQHLRNQAHTPVPQPAES